VIKAIVFDIGGVLLDWNPRHLYTELFDGDDEAMERFLADVCSPAWNLSLDAGRPFAEGVAELCWRFPQQAALITAYDLRWEDMVRGAFEDTVDLARELKANGFPLYALTNFSCEKMALVRPRYDFFTLFDAMVVSGEIGIVKPDPAIYRHLLERFDLVADETLFIDDSAVNVAAAAAAGLRATHSQSAPQLSAELRRSGLL
jgi:2-haloacid dehalogenase